LDTPFEEPDGQERSLQLDGVCALATVASGTLFSLRPGGLGEQPCSCDTVYLLMNQLDEVEKKNGRDVYLYFYLVFLFEKHFQMQICWCISICVFKIFSKKLFIVPVK